MNTIKRSFLAGTFSGVLAVSALLPGQAAAYGAFRDLYGYQTTYTENPNHVDMMLGKVYGSIPMRVLTIPPPIS